MIPEGKELYVNGSIVIVEGIAANYGTLTLANGAHVKGDIAGTFQMAGGTFETGTSAKPGYVMIGATQGKYLSSDAKFTILPNMDMIFVSGTVTLNENKWYTLEGQTLTVNAGATFVIPAGKTLYVNESTVVVNGEIELEGTVQLTANATVAYADGTLVEKFVTNAGDTVIYENGVYKAHTHDHNAVVTAPTCTEKGYTTYTCTCGDTYVDDYVNETGHSHESVYHAPTNTENAYTVYTCHCGDTYTVVEEGTMLHFAINVTTGESYESVQAALNAASKGDTVKLLKDATESFIYVGVQKTLDLNGHTLTADTVSASFTTSQIMDSTDGLGLLKVDKENISLNSGNKYLPIWTEEGARFEYFKFKQRLEIVDNGNTAYFRFYVNKIAAKTMVDEYLANGTLTLRVKATWTNANGINCVQYFEYPAEMIRDMINSDNGWDGNMFTLYLRGISGTQNLQLDAEIVSVANAQATVVASELYQS